MTVGLAVRLLDRGVQLGIPAVAVLVAMVYSDLFSGYWVPKTAAVMAGVPFLCGLLLVRSALARKLELRSTPLLWPCLLFAAVSLTSLLWAPNPGRGLEAATFRLSTLALAFLTLNAYGDPLQLRRLFAVLVGGAALISAAGLLQYAGIHLIPDIMVYSPGWGATLGNLNFVAHYLDVIIPLAVALLFLSSSGLGRVGASLALALTGSYLVVSQSRAGWFAVSVGLLLMVLFSGMGVRHLRHLAFAAVVLALLSPAAELVGRSVSVGQGRTATSLLEGQFERTWERLLSASDRGDFSLLQRRIIWADSWSLVRAHPVLGIGFGNFPIEVAAHRNPDRHERYYGLTGDRRLPLVTKHAHNDYIEVWAEVGLPGLLALLAMLGAVLWCWERDLRHHPSRESRLLGLGGLGAIAATAVHALFSFNFKDPVASTHLWIVAGAILALASRRQRQWSLDRRWQNSLILAAGVGAIAAGAHFGVRQLLGDLTYMAGQALYLKKDRGSEARKLFEEAVAWRYHDHHYHYMVGHTSASTGEFVLAAAALERSLALHPNYKLSLYLYGKILFERGRYEDAAARLERAVIVDPNYLETARYLSLAHQRLAVTRRAEGLHEEAVDHWQRALEMVPGEVNLINGLAVEYHHAGRVDAAIVLLEQAAVAHPNDGRMMGNLGSFYALIGRYREAETYLLRGLRQYPDDLGFWQQLVKVYRADGRLEEASRRLRGAVEMTGSASLRGALERMLSGLKEEER